MTETLNDDDIRLHCDLCSKAQGYEPDYYSCPCLQNCGHNFCYDCCQKLWELSKDEICPFCLYDGYQQLTEADMDYLNKMGFFKQEEPEDGFEDCGVCGYTHHSEDKCPRGKNTEYYQKWLKTLECEECATTVEEPISSLSSSQPQALSSVLQPSSEK